MRFSFELNKRHPYLIMQRRVLISYLVIRILTIPRIHVFVRPVFSLAKCIVLQRRKKERKKNWNTVYIIIVERNRSL